MQNYTPDKLITPLAEIDQQVVLFVNQYNRIEVFRDYKVKIDFNFDFEQFQSGLDYAA